MDHRDTPWWFLLVLHSGCGSSWRASTTLRGLTWVWDIPLSICVMSGLPLRRSSQGNTSSLNLFVSSFLKLKIQCWRFFLPHPSSPARRGSTTPPKSSLLRRKDLKPGRPGLYSQTSSRPCGVARRVLRNRVAIIYAPWAPMRIMCMLPLSFFVHRLSQIVLISKDIVIITDYYHQSSIINQ